MPDNMTRYAVHAAGELGLQDIIVERRAKHMRLTARTAAGLPVMVGFSEKAGDWRVRRHFLAELRRQVRGVRKSHARHAAEVCHV